MAGVDSKTKAAQHCTTMELGSMLANPSPYLLSHHMVGVQLLAPESILRDTVIPI